MTQIVIGGSGAPGISGYSGISGQMGMSGYSGVIGSSGYSGVTGSSGYSGVAGSGSAITGELRIWPTATAPTGWLLCDGAEYSDSDPEYTDLYAIIGTTFGSGTGTFKVPDLRGRVPLGADNMGGVSANRVTDTAADSIGGNSGYEAHVLSVSELASHSHSYTDTQIVLGPPTVLFGGTGYHPSGVASTTGAAGTNTAHYNLQPYLTLSYIIKK